MVLRPFGEKELLVGGSEELGMAEDVVAESAIQQVLSDPQTVQAPKPFQPCLGFRVY